MACSSAVNLDCSYGNFEYVVAGTAYQCGVANNLSMTSPEEAVIRSVSGIHMSGKTNDDVTAFHVYSKTIEFFPRGLEKFFKNLKAIDIKNNQIRQILNFGKFSFFGLIVQ